MSAYATGGPVRGPGPVVLSDSDFTPRPTYVPLSALSRHEVCLFRTAELENDLFGDVISTSVKDHIEAWLDARQTWMRAQYVWFACRSCTA